MANDGLAIPDLVTGEKCLPNRKGQFSDIIYLHHKELLDVLHSRNPEECSQAIRFHILQRLSDFDPQLSIPENVLLQGTSNLSIQSKKGGPIYIFSL